jgi:hypothetical protein
VAVHTDGTIFTLINHLIHPPTSKESVRVAGIDPTTGAEKFSVPFPNMYISEVVGPIIAGDGYAYMLYSATDSGTAESSVVSLMLPRVNSAGASNNIQIQDFVRSAQHPIQLTTSMIANADTGVFLNWEIAQGDPDSPAPPPSIFGAAVVSGTGVNLISAPTVPGEIELVPVLQRADGSFIGKVNIGAAPIGQSPQYNNMVAFDASGSELWYVPNDEPQMATADGGVIGRSGIIYDQNGSATGQLGNLPTYSWKGAYLASSILSSVNPRFDLAFLAQTRAAVPRGNLTGNGFALAHRTFGLVFCGPDAPNAPNDGPCTGGSRPTDPPPFDPVRYAYLEAANLNSTTYTTAMDFGLNQTGGITWPNIIKTQAYNQYKAAFEHLPAIVARDIKPLYGGNSSGITKFFHTIYVHDGWSNIAMGITEPNTLCGSVDTNKQVCNWSELFFMSYVEQSQQALAYLHTNDTGHPPPVSPHYSNPLDPTTEAQFVELMKTIGFGIGTGAAHETGHQIFLPHMDCGRNDKATCPEDRIYENGVGDSSHPWFYGNLTGQPIHWSPDARCALKRYLLATYNLPCN